MKGSIVGKKGIHFPKLMINENVVALFSDRHTAVVVHMINEDAIPVGKSLGYDSFDIDRFSDFHGTIELSN